MSYKTGAVGKATGTKATLGGAVYQDPRAMHKNQAAGRREAMQAPQLGGILQELAARYSAQRQQPAAQQPAGAGQGMSMLQQLAAMYGGSGVR